MKRFLFLTIACLFSICGMAQIVADTSMWKFFIFMGNNVV